MRRLATIPRWQLAVPGLATAAAVTVAATLLASGHVTGRQAPPGRPASLTARDVLLTAATAVATAAAAAPGTGKYLVQTSVSGELLASGPNSRPYVIERRYGLTVSWQPTSPGTSTQYVSADYTSRLPTSGAVSAWHADGSPLLPRQSGQRPRVVTYPDSLRLGNEDLTIAQLQALPSSTAGLKAAIVRGLQATPDANEGRFPLGNQEISDVCSVLIGNPAVTPAVRAAAYRILAALPGISLAGRIIDPLGRTGYGVTLPGMGGLSSGGNSVIPKARQRLVISPSGALLATEDVAAAPTTSVVTVMPASGAIPGPASCQAGQVRTGNQCFDKLPAPHVTVIYTPGARADGKRVRIRGGVISLGGPVLTLGAPVLAVPAGTVVDYQAFVSAGLTNASPPSVPSLPPVSAESAPPPG
jgi:hypothetical protein